MQNSEKLDEIFKALAKFQGELSNASKDKQGHGYKYADLGQCIEQARTPLSANGLSVTQFIGTDERGDNTLTTVLGHESGQHLSSKFVMVSAMLQGQAGKNPAQVLGSAITYQRRYAFAAIIGLAQEDDDAASVPAQDNRQPARHPHEEVQKNPELTAADMENALKEFTKVCFDIQTLNELKVEFQEIYRFLDESHHGRAKKIYDDRKHQILSED